MDDLPPPKVFGRKKVDVDFPQIRLKTAESLRLQEALVDGALFNLDSHPDGEYPRVYGYRTLAELCRKLHELEGTKTAVSFSYGIPFGVSKPDSKGVRYLVSPDQILVIRMGVEGPRILTGEELELTVSTLQMQNDGWIGDPALSQEGLSAALSEVSKRRGRSGRPVANRPNPADFESDGGEGEPTR